MRKNTRIFLLSRPSVERKKKPASARSVKQKGKVKSYIEKNEQNRTEQTGQGGKGKATREVDGRGERERELESNRKMCGYLKAKGERERENLKVENIPDGRLPAMCANSGRRARVCIWSV